MRPPSGWLVLAATLGVAALSGCEDAQDHINRARSLTWEKKPEAALKQYRLALDIIERDESAEARVLQARALKGAADVYYLELRDFRRAVEVYEELIRECPEAPESLDARIQLAAILHNHFHNARGAISALTGAIERNAPQSAELEYEVAKLYFELSDYQQATLEAQKVEHQYETSPWVDDAMFLEAQALGMMEGRSADAFRAMERLVGKFPDSELVPFALYEMGKLKTEAGQREAAIDLWVRALERHPDPQMVQRSIDRVRKQIIERTPAGVGRAAYAFDHVADSRPPLPHRTSLEAMGARPDEAGSESD
ncbi:MAG: tetratricopeptide repeat protein [Myxococcaceae bacterium]|nr:tetratricopeptide repeat protein [Myxococcaceae bacterium]